jgi:transcriptional regulator GlxA family with amidase domain
MTSAGSAAGIDLCLHIIRKDHGAEVANRVARSFVMPPHREGGQSQYIERPIPAVEAPNRWSRVVAWAKANLARDLAVGVLARHAGMSPRTFARRFRAELGVTPHQWLLHQRLIEAQRMLETSDASIDRVAEAVGLQTAATMRQHFQRRFRTSPSAYRRRFTIRA